MIAHLFKLVWNRKRANGLILLEMFISFLVVFALLATSTHLYRAYTRPLGFAWENVWAIEIGVRSAGDDQWVRDNPEVLDRLLREIRSFDEVDAAAMGNGYPYDHSESIYSTRYRERSIQAAAARASDDYADVLSIELVRGRWFEEADAALGHDPIVIDQELAREVFGSEDPLGQPVPFGEHPDENRVIGVMRDFRKGGEFAPPQNFFFERASFTDAEQRVTALLVRLRPGVSAEFEARLVARCEAVSNRISFDVQHLERNRASALNLVLAPLLAGGIVAVFLLLMVGLGLIGVLWQNVTQRTREIGLRRAAGAPEVRIHRQILTELWLLTTISVAIGVVLVLQLPLLGLVPAGFDPGAYTGGLVASLAVMYLLATACGLYPSRAATRVPPAEALHYE